MNRPDKKEIGLGAAILGFLALVSGIVFSILTKSPVPTVHPNDTGLPHPAPEPQAIPTPKPVPVPVVRGSAKMLAIAVPLICAFEGCYTYAYRDPVGVPTVCFGHIERVKMGDKYTKEQCKDMLLEDLPRYQKMVDHCVKVPMPDHRYAAILSFTYNVGGGNLCKSSVARKLNAGDVEGGCRALLLYNRAHGIVLPGLTRRREEERKLCLMED